MVTTAPETTLFDRKLKLVSDSLSCRQLFADLETTDADIDRLGRERIEADQRLTSAQAQLAEAESLASLSIEGKNESERKARKIQLLREDPAYRDAASWLREAERQRDELDVDLESLRRKARRIERNIDYRTAMGRLFGN